MEYPFTVKTVKCDLELDNLNVLYVGYKILVTVPDSRPQILLLSGIVTNIIDKHAEGMQT